MPSNPLRRQFPALSQRVNGQPLAYLDSAATTQKPTPVIAAIQQFYRRDNANVHRGAHQLSERATDAYESARNRVASWLETSPEQVIWTSGATASVNLVAQSWGLNHVQEGDQIIVSALEHHANLIPWQQVAKAKGAELLVAPIDDTGTIDVSAFKALLSPKVKLAAFCHLSNVLGTVQPVSELCQLAQEAGAVTVVDGAQAVAHLQPKPEQIGCDFYLFSGHKMYGPTGIGVLWGKKTLLERLIPWQTGGEMVVDVSYQAAKFAPLPHRLEAGTPNIAGAIGLGAAVDFMQQQDWTAIELSERKLIDRCREVLQDVSEVSLLPYSAKSAASVGFTIDNYHPADVAQWLDHFGVAVRAGHHCAQPLHDRLGIKGSVRVSFACYSDLSEVEQLNDGLKQLLADRNSDVATENVQKSRGDLLAEASAVRGWEATYQFLLSAAVQPNIAVRRPETQVSGCDSRTWVDLKRTSENALKLHVDSESAVVRGILAVVQAIAETLPAEQWRCEVFLQRLDALNLLPFVSETRINGINAVLQRIESYSAELLASR